MPKVRCPAVLRKNSTDPTAVPNEFQFDVFLSHSSKDKAVVRPLAERLRKDGLKVWFYEWEIRPGDSIPGKVEEGLQNSRILVLCMSASAFGSDWSHLESGTFRFRDPMNRNRRLIPLRLDNAPIKGSLAQFLYIGWLPKDRAQNYVKLLKSCRHPASWPRPTKDRLRKSSHRSRARKGSDELLADGLDATEVLRAIRDFHRAIWDYRDSLDWVQRLSRRPKGSETEVARNSRAATREYCGNRNVAAWQQAAATLPIILRADERFGIATDDFKNVIADCPNDSQWLSGVEGLVRQVEAQLRQNENAL